jgi:hypothetical protein
MNHLGSKYKDRKPDQLRENLDYSSRRSGIAPEEEIQGRQYYAHTARVCHG